MRALRLREPSSGGPAPTVQPRWFKTPRSIAERPEDRSTSSCPRAHMFAATGRTAFGEGNPDALFYRTLNEPPELDDCPPTLHAAVKRCLARDPKKRPAVSELMEYARKQTAGETLTLAGSWLPEAVATSLTGYDTKPYVPPKTKKAHKGDTATATTEKSTNWGYDRGQAPGRWRREFVRWRGRRDRTPRPGGVPRHRPGQSGRRDRRTVQGLAVTVTDVLTAVGLPFARLGRDRHAGVPGIS